MFAPKVSIVIPVYNGSNYMREAIDSALAQTYKNIEVIVVNDGSRDFGETDRIARSYGDRIRYYLKPNGGVATALNLGIEKMTGEYFSWLSHDDKYKPQKIELQIKQLAELEDKTTLLYGGYALFSDDKGIFEEIDFTKHYKRKDLENSLFPVFHLALNGCTLLVHKSHFERAGLFNPNLPTTQDYELWFRIFRGQKPYCMPGYQVLSRSHPDQGSRALYDIHIHECEKMWRNCISKMTNEEMVSLNGSPYAFFTDLYEFFTTHCGYPGLNAYLRSRAIQELSRSDLPTDAFFRNEYTKINAEMSFFVKKDMNVKDKSRVRVAFFLGDVNALGGLNRIVLHTAGVLSSELDVWLIDTVKYNGTGYALDENVHEVTTNMNIDEIIDILSLAQIDVFVGSYNCLGIVLELYNRARAIGVKVIAWNHENYFAPYHFDLYNRLGYRRETFSQAQAVVWLTNYSAEIYKLHHDNGIVIPNMLTIEENTHGTIQECKYSKKENEKIIIGISRFDDVRKGLDRLLRAFTSIYEQNRNVKLLLVGKIDWDAPCYTKKSYLNDPHVKTYKDVLKSCNLPANVVVATGEVSDVTPYWQMADLHLMSSFYEGFGLVITEASTYNVPTVAFTGNGYEDIIQNGETGYIVENEKEMAQKALLLLNDETKLKAMGKAAHDALDKFSPAVVGNAWKDLIQHVAEDDEEALKQYLQSKRKKEQLPVETLTAIIREYEEDICLRQETPACVVQTDEAYWKQQAKAMENTVSWRITAPLRKVRGLMLKMKQGGKQ